MDMGKRTISREIANYLAEIIEKNSGTPNYKLPSQSVLQKQFGVSHIPVRSAYAHLIERGLVTNWHGKGYFIKDALFKDTLPSQKKVYFITPHMRALFMRRVLEGIQNFCNAQMLTLSIMTSDQNIKKEQSLLQSIKQSDSKGVIIYPVDNELYNEELLKLSARRFPIVIVDRNLKGMNISYVAMDNYKAMVDAVKFLYDKKYKNIVYVTPPPSLATTIEERLNGFNHGLFKYYGIARAENLLKIKPDDLLSIQQELVKHLKKYSETDVLIVTGAQATLALKAAAELNIPVPGKLRLMIIDNELSDTETNFVQPYIIHMDGYEMGYKAATALYNQIYGDSRIIFEKLPVKIIDCSIPPEAHESRKS